MSQEVKVNVPKKYQKYFGYVELNVYEPDSEDAEKYILHYADGYAYKGEYPIWFCKSKKEVIEYLKYAEVEKRA